MIVGIAPDSRGPFIVSGVCDSVVIAFHPPCNNGGSGQPRLGRGKTSSLRSQNVHATPIASRERARPPKSSLSSSAFFRWYMVHVPGCSEKLAQGAAAEGRGPSIWDTFSTAGHAKDGATGTCQTQWAWAGFSWRSIQACQVVSVPMFSSFENLSDTHLDHEPFKFVR